MAVMPPTTIDTMIIAGRAEMIPSPAAVAQRPSFRPSVIGGLGGIWVTLRTARTPFEVWAPKLRRGFVIETM
jgi:hypothetical protein